MAYQLAQVNVARLLAPLESAQLEGFVQALDPVNASAEAAPGFVWRLKTDEGNATSIRAFEWDVGDAARHHREHERLGFDRTPSDLGQ